jgi:hypothetical protein
MTPAHSTAPLPFCGVERNTSVPMHATEQAARVGVAA